MSNLSSTLPVPDGVNQTGFNDSRSTSSVKTDNISNDKNVNKNLNNNLPSVTNSIKKAVNGAKSSKNTRKISKVNTSSKINKPSKRMSVSKK